MALVVVGAILLPLAGVSVWSRNQLLDTGNYTDTIAPLASDPAIQAAVEDRLAEAVLEVADIEARAEEALPDNAKFLAAPIAAGAENLVRDLAVRLVESDEFQRLWIEVNRIAHSQVVALLEGKSTASVDRSDGQVVVSLGPIAEQLLDRLDNVVPIDLSQVPTERLNVAFVLMESDDLASVQSLVNVFTKLTWLLLALALAALIGAALLAPDRRRGMQRVGIGIIISTGVTLLLYGLARDRYLAALPSTVRSPAAAAAAFDIATRYLERGIRAVLAVGVVLFVAGWLPGPSRSATWVRNHTKWATARGAPGDAADGEVEGAPTWVGSHANELRATIIGAAILILVLWSRPTGKVVLLLSILVAAGLIAVQLVGGPSRSATASDELV